MGDPEDHGFLFFSSWVPSSNSGVLPQSSSMQVIRTVNSKLPVGVNVSVNV